MPKRTVRRARSAEDEHSLESKIVGLAETGKLKTAARAAVEAQRANNLSIVFRRGHSIVRESPNGQVVVLHVLPRVAQKLPSHLRSLIAARTGRRHK